MYALGGGAMIVLRGSRDRLGGCGGAWGQMMTAGARLGLGGSGSVREKRADSGGVLEVDPQDF